MGRDDVVVDTLDAVLGQAPISANVTSKVPHGILPVNLVGAVG